MPEGAEGFMQQEQKDEELMARDRNVYWRIGGPVDMP